jgi:hypothetical protein
MADTGVSISCRAKPMHWIYNGREGRGLILFSQPKCCLNTSRKITGANHSGQTSFSQANPSSHFTLSRRSKMAFTNEFYGSNNTYSHGHGCQT